MSALKKKAQELVARLPDDATWSDLAYEIRLRQKIEEGLGDLDAGRSTAQTKVRELFLER